MFKNLLPAVLVLSALSITPAHAALSYYVGNATESSFNADLLSAGLTASGIINYGSITGFSGNSTTVNGTTFAGNNFTVPGTSLINGSSADITITPGATTYAYGMHIGTVTSSAFTCFTGDCLQALTLNSTPQFFGVISTTPLSAFTADVFGGVQLVITDFKLGTLESSGGGGGEVGEVPEPSTMALLGSALIAFPVLLRKRRVQ